MTASERGRLPPRPWINVVSNGNYGLVAGQTGTGFSWLTNANLNRITRFSQDMVQDDMGKFLYIRDDVFLQARRVAGESGLRFSFAAFPRRRAQNTHLSSHAVRFTISLPPIE